MINFCWLMLKIFLSIFTILISSMISRHYYIYFLSKKSGLDKTFLKYMLENKNYGYTIINILFDSLPHIKKLEKTFREKINYELENEDSLLHQDICFSTGRDIIKRKNIDDILLSSINLNNDIRQLKGPFLIHFDYEEKKIVLLVSHYFYDGKSIFNKLIKYLVNEIEPIKFISKPTYIPIYFEFLQLEFIFRNLFLDSLNLPLKTLNQENKLIPNIYFQKDLKKVKELKTQINSQFNQNINFSSVIIGLISKDLYESLEDEIKMKKRFFKAMVIVGFEGQPKEKNNFGFITIYIYFNLMNNLTELILNINNQLKKYYTDSFISMEIINNYGEYLNNNNNNQRSDYDINFSCFQHPYLGKNDKYDVNQINIKLYDLFTSLYCFCLSDHNSKENPKIHISISLNTDQINAEKLKEIISSS